MKCQMTERKQIFFIKKEMIHWLQADQSNTKEDSTSGSSGNTKIIPDYQKTALIYQKQIFLD